MGFVACLNLPLAAGAHLVLLEPLDWVARPASLLAAIARHRATLTWQPNFAFALLAARTPASADVDLASLRGAVSLLWSP